MLRHLVITILCVTLASCSGYRLGDVKPAKLQHIQSITIPQFKNDTLVPRVSTLVTNSTVDAIAQDGTYAIRSYDQSDAVLHATVTQIEYDQFRANRFDTLASDELKVTIHVSWELKQQGVTLISSTSTGSTTFDFEDNLAISRQNALPLASARTAQNIVSQLSEGF